ncbi:uracil-xanthine permease family protein [Fusibacter sp. JL216-2]|uniref:uracil-xanthine permease family protein n=1 Tax=Fusibacter sp. JL216-2 TaxID=3071453 RepID=UPI003D350755
MTTKVMSGGASKSTGFEQIKQIILGLQHLVAMFGATVLVPILTGFDPSVALVAAGCGTLIFHFCTKKKVPVFLGSSFAFIPLILTVKEMHGGDLAYAQGGIMVAGLMYVLLSLCIKTIGVEKINKFLPPHVVGPMIMVIGLNLVPVALDMASGQYVVAGVTLAVALGVTLLAKGFTKQLSILIGVLTGYAVAAVMGIVDTSAVSQAAVIAVPAFRMPKFSLAAIMTIAPVVIAVFMEHIGDVKTNGTVVGKDFIKDPGLNRTLLGDGLATMFAGFIGGPANTTYGENTGVLAITKNYDPKILRIAAIFAIVLGMVAKLGAVLKTIPVPVMGGISLMLFSMIALVGFRTVRDNKVEMNWKNTTVMGSILILGFGASYIQSLTGITLAIPVTETVSISGLSFAAIVGVTLNAVLNR